MEYRVDGENTAVLDCVGVINDLRMPAHGGSDAGVTVLDPNSNLVVPDAISGWGTDTLDIIFTTPLLADGQYTLTLHGSAIHDEFGTPLAGGSDVVGPRHAGPFRSCVG